LLFLLRMGHLKIILFWVYFKMILR